MESYRALDELPTPRSVIRMNAATDPSGAAHRIIELEAEIARLTERYGAVRHAYGVEAQERGRLEQRLQVAVETLEKIGGGNSERIRMSAEMAYQVAHSALDRLRGKERS